MGSRKTPILVYSFILLMSVAAQSQVRTKGVLADLKLPAGERLVQVSATADLSRWAAVVETESAGGEKLFSVRTEAGKLGPFVRIARHSFRYHPDGKTLLFAASVPSTEPDPGWYIYTGKSRTGPFRDLLDVTFAADGRLVSRIEATEEGAWVLHAGKEQFGPFLSAENAGVFSGGLRAWILRDGEGARLAAGAGLFGPYETIDGIRAIAWTNTVLFRFTREGKTYLYDGKTELGPFDEASVPEIAPDGKSVAYASGTSGTWSVMMNGKRVGIHPAVEGLYFTGDSSRVVYWVREKDSYYVISGTAKLGPYAARGTVLFPPGKSILAYSAGLAKDMFLFTGEGRLGPYRAIHDMRYSADGKMLGWLTEEAAGTTSRTRFGAVTRIADMAGYSGGLAVSPTGLETAFAGTSADGHAVWKGAVRFGPFAEPYTSLSYSPDGKFLELSAPSTADTRLVAEGVLAAGSFIRDALGKPVAAVWADRGRILFSRF